MNGTNISRLVTIALGGWLYAVTAVGKVPYLGAMVDRMIAECIELGAMLDSVTYSISTVWVGAMV
jgi:hypothetical protein